MCLLVRFLGAEVGVVRVVDDWAGRGFGDGVAWLVLLWF